MPLTVRGELKDLLEQLPLGSQEALISIVERRIKVERELAKLEGISRGRGIERRELKEALNALIDCRR